MVGSDSSDDEHRERTTDSQGSTGAAALKRGGKVHSYSLCFVGNLLDFGEDAAASGFVREVPFQVESPIVQVSCGLDFVCLLTASGRVYSTGTSRNDQPESHKLASPLVPRPLPFPVEKKIVRLSCGASHGGFVVENGSLFMFGCSSYGRLGIGDSGARQYYHTPVQVRMTWSALQAKVARAKAAVSCGIPVIHQKLTAADGIPPSTSATVAASAPPQVSPETNESPHEEDDEVVFADISCGDRHTLVLGVKASSIPSSSSSNSLSLVKHSIISFGDGMNGRLGIGSESDEATGALVTVFKAPQYATHGGVLLPKITSIAVGVAHSAALSSSGELFTWGNGADGQLGHGSCESEWVPRQVEFFKSISLVSVKCGARHTVAVTRTGIVYTWGSGQEGQLGSGLAGLHAKDQDLEQEQQQRNEWRLPEKVQLIVDPLAIQQMNIDAQVQAAFTTASALGGGGSLGTSSLSSAAASTSQQQLQQADRRVTVRSIVAAASGSMALDDHARLFTWGCNRDRQLGVPLSETCDKAKCPSVEDTLSHATAWIVPKPRQIMYMNLRESTTHMQQHQKRIRSSSRVTTIRDQVHAMAINGISRQALVHFAASDRFSVLVFTTELARTGSSGAALIDSESSAPLIAIANELGSERNTTAPALSSPNRPQLRLLAQQQQQSGKWKLVTNALAREQTISKSIAEGLTSKGLLAKPVGSKWHFSLLQELRTEDVPSKESEYYQLMANYKVYLRRPGTAATGGGGAPSPGTATSSERLRAQNFLGLEECVYDIGGFQALANPGGDDHFSVSTDRNAHRAAQRAVTSRRATSANNKMSRAPDSANSGTTGGPEASMNLANRATSNSGAALSPQHVRGFDDWLKKHSPSKSPKRKARSASGNATRVQRRTGNTISSKNNNKDNQVQSPRLAAKAATDGKTTVTRPQSSRVPEPRPPLLSPKMRPSRPKTAFGRLSHTIVSAHKPAVAPPPSSTAGSSNTSSNGTASAAKSAAPVPPPQRSSPKSAKRAASASARSRRGPPSLKLQFQWQQQELGLSAFKSSTKSRFDVESHLKMKDTLTPLHPETSTPLVYPTSPRFSMGSGEDFSLVVARRLARARGGTPGPGAYDSHGG